MPNAPYIISIIPARGGSKRLPGKNLKPLAGRSLLAWSIHQSLATPGISRHLVSTDDPAIAEEAEAQGAEVIRRPEQLATDTASTLSVCQHALQSVEQDGRPVDFVVLLQPTSPFRRNGDVEAAIQRMLTENADALVAVSKSKFGPEWTLREEGGALQFAFPNGFESIRTQDQAAFFHPNGYLYIYSRQCLLGAMNYAWGAKTLSFEVPEPFDLDIDSPNDYLIAKAIANGYPYDWQP